LNTIISVKYSLCTFIHLSTSTV